MTEQHCLKVEPASLLTITEHTAPPGQLKQQTHTQLDPQEPLTLHFIWSFIKHMSSPRVRYTHSFVEHESCPRIRYIQSCSFGCMRSCCGSWHINSLLCSSYKIVHPAGQADCRILLVAVLNCVASTRCIVQRPVRCFDQLYTQYGMTDSTHRVVFCVQACITAALMKRLAGHSHSKEKKRKEKTTPFRHQINKKPSIIPGCPGAIAKPHWLEQRCKLCCTHTNTHVQSTPFPYWSQRSLQLHICFAMVH